MFELEQDKEFKMKDIAKRTSWKKVKKAMLYYYPHERKNLEGYEKIYEKIKKYRNSKQEDEKEYLEVKLFIENFGYDDEEDRDGYYSIATNKYSCSFRSWKALANIKVKRNNLRDADLVAHFLWEITFFGFQEQKIKKQGEELHNMCKNVEKDVEKYTVKLK